MKNQIKKTEMPQPSGPMTIMENDNFQLSGKADISLATGKQKEKRMLKNESANDGIYDLPSGAVTAIDYITTILWVRGTFLQLIIHESIVQRNIWYNRNNHILESLQTVFAEARAAKHWKELAKRQHLLIKDQKVTISMQANIIRNNGQLILDDQ